MYIENFMKLRLPVFRDFASKHGFRKYKNQSWIQGVKRNIHRIL